MAYPYATKRLRTGVASYAWQNRAKIRWAAKKIWRTYRRYKRRGSARRSRFSKRAIGERIGSSSAKVAQHSADHVLRATRTLYLVDVCNIQHVSGAETIDKRERNLINLRGVKVCAEVRNLGNKPLYFNLAMICPKQDGLSDVDIASNFFRSNGMLSTERGVGFGRTDLLNSVDYHCKPLNTDKMTVIMHKRYTLAGLTATNSTTSGYGSQTGKTYAFIQKYRKIGRQIRYDSVTDVNPINGNVFLAYWFDTMGSKRTTAAVADQAEIAYDLLTYFRDPRP